MNKKEEKEKNMNEVKRLKKMINSKKLQIKKNKYNNPIEHDKQSTTMDENE